MSHEYDLVVIGSGPGGYVAAIRASQLGMKTAIVEMESLGGVCLNWGCIPTKALLKTAELAHEMNRASDFGFASVDVRPDFSKVVQYSRGVADKMSKGVQFLMKKNKVDVVNGRGQLGANRQVIVKDANGQTAQTLKAKNIIVATGARARSLPNLKVDEKSVITYKTALTQSKQPSKLLIVGAGAIGVEFAYFYNAMGTDVTIVEYQDTLLPIEDTDVSKELLRHFKKQKIKCLVGSSVESLAPKPSGVTASIKANKDGKTSTLDVDQVLVAVGVQGNVENLGLETLGIKTDKSFIKVDSKYSTGVNGVYAIGDVVGPPLLAHVASAEAIRCVEWIAGLPSVPVNYDQIPGCTYCQPQVASIGLTEQAAREKGLDIKVGKFPFSASGKASAIGHTAGFVKKIFDAKYNQLIGAHIIGAEATELLAASGIALSHEATAESIASTIHAHPTLSEALMEATEDGLGHAIHI